MNNLRVSWSHDCVCPALFYAITLLTPGEVVPSPPVQKVSVRWQPHHLCWYLLKPSSASLT